ncbi:hypothetical protein ACTXT7_007520, partial [Hymenolepis weldensis]
MPGNATPQSSRAAKNLVEEFGWEVMHHPPCSPDFLLHQPIFIFSGEEVEMKELVSFFESKLAKLYEEGMRKAR